MSPTLPSPAQERLLDDLRAELPRLRGLAARGAHLRGIRAGTATSAALRYVGIALSDAFFALERTERDGGTLDCRFTSERGAELVYVPPPATVLYLDDFRKRQAAG